MKLIQVIMLLIVMASASVASADVLLVKKSKKVNVENDLDHHRYDDEIEKMNSMSSSLADRMLNPEKYEKIDNKNDKLQVRLISKR